MASVLVPLAPGFEELEAVTVIDILRRANIQVVVAGLNADPVKGSRGTLIVPDTDLDSALTHDHDMVVLPGGLPGADHLADDPRIVQLLRKMADSEKFTAAICAAPKVLAKAGLLEGRKATAYPGVLEKTGVKGIRITDESVVQDGKVITSRGPGTAMDFALNLVAQLTDDATRNKVEAALQRP